MPEFDYTNYGPKYKDISGFPGYRVGTDGSVWSCKVIGSPTKRGSWRRLKPGTDSSGYLKVCLSDASKKRFMLGISILVAKAFLGRPSMEHEVAHWNGRPKNNVLHNLRWATHAENMADKYRHGTHAIGEMSPVAKIKEQDVAEIIRLYNSGETQANIAKLFQVAQSTICEIINGESWKHVNRAVVLLGRRRYGRICFPKQNLILGGG